MNKAFQLPSGKILSLNRFIALLPVSDTINCDYDLILEGYSTPIKIEYQDVEALKDLLQLNTDNPVSLNQSEWNPREQLSKNQRAMELLAKRIQRNQNMSDEESRDNQELLENLKQTIDAQRLPGQKLYSEKYSEK